MEDTEKQEPTQWFVFFKDQLLLKKEKTEKGEIKYRVPYGTELPLNPGTGSTIHEVFRHRTTRCGNGRMGYGQSPGFL